MKKTAAAIAAFLLIAGQASPCTTVIVSSKASATGRPLLWKQRDSSVGFNYLDHFPAKDGNYSYTGMVNTADTRRESLWCGTNEKGFSIINSMSYGLSPIITDNRPYEGMVMKKALETCADIEEFEVFINSLEKPNGLESNFGVIDAHGGAAYFEVHDLGYTRFDAGDSAEGYLIRTNYSMTGREGEGKGYDRYDITASLMAEHQGGFGPEWIIDKLGREATIARGKTISSVVFEGIGQGDSTGSTVIWCAAGYTPYCYAIPVWAAAGGLIPEPLRKSSGQGSDMNELAFQSLKAAGDIEPDKDGNFIPTGRQAQLMREARLAEDREIQEGRLLDARFRSQGFDADAVKAYNKEVTARFRKFRNIIWKTGR